MQSNIEPEAPNHTRCRLRGFSNTPWKSSDWSARICRAASTHAYRKAWCCPVTIAIGFQASVKACSKQHEPQQKVRKDMRFIRQAYRTFALVSGLSFIHARFSVPAGASFASVLVSVIIWSLSPLAGEIARLLQYDEVIYMASGFVWLALNFRELEQTGASFSWWKAICGLAGTTCAFGPGAAFAFGWDRREGILDRMSSYNRSQ